MRPSAALPSSSETCSTVRASGAVVIEAPRRKPEAAES